MPLEYPTALTPERLMTHMRVFCQAIGPRPAASDQEREAAEYVQRILQLLGVRDVETQPFRTQTAYDWVVLPNALACVAASAIAAFGGLPGKLLAGLTYLGSAYTFRQFMHARPPVYQTLIARSHSQNVIAHFPAAQNAKRTLFIVGHLDTQKQRMMAPPPKPEWMKLMNTASVGVVAATGVSLLLDVVLGRKKLSPLQWALSGTLAATTLIAMTDALQPYVEGANDNASAVSVLLGLAEALSAQPLQNTAVTLLFTGSEETVCVGMEEFLKEYAPSTEDTYWLDLEMVGTGNLCYVMKHGITHTDEYLPGPEMVQLAARTAHKYPELGVVGKEMLMVEEVANLRHWGYNALCLAGYDEKGFLPNWHRLSDTLENIEPATLSRAARYTWALMHELDNLR